VLSDEAGAKLESFIGALGYMYFDLDEVGPPRLVPHIQASSHWNYLICQPGVAETLGLLPSGERQHHSAPSHVDGDHE
jgi:hypothetical protein